MAANHGACRGHCCPTHGCKYGHADCPVARLLDAPAYAANNGCEMCKAAEEARSLAGEPGKTVTIAAPDGHDLGGMVEVTFWSDGRLNIEVSAGHPVMIEACELVGKQADFTFAPDWNRG